MCINHTALRPTGLSGQCVGQRGAGFNNTDVVVCERTGTAKTRLVIDLGLIGHVTVQERDLAGEIWWGTLYEASVVSPSTTSDVARNKGMLSCDGAGFRMERRP